MFEVGLSPQNHPFKSATNGGNKIVLFIYVKRAKAKNNVISYLCVSRVRNDQGQQFLSEALLLTATPKGVIQKRNKIDINLFESAKAKKNSGIAYLIVFSEYGMANASISCVALPLTATPKWVKRG